MTESKPSLKAENEQLRKKIEEIIQLSSQNRKLTKEVIAAKDELISLRIEEANNLRAEVAGLREAAEACLHQISTDSDLDELVTAPEKYDAVETMLRAALARKPEESAGKMAEDAAKLSSEVRDIISTARRAAPELEGVVRRDSTYPPTEAYEWEWE
jgi:hypothetical protein